jgi:hypothetical protein
VPTGCRRNAVDARSLRWPISERSRRFSTNRAKFNRQIQEVERLVTRRKQRIALSSNRQKFQFCETKNFAATKSSTVNLRAFLPGSALRVECDVTYSKQKAAPFLPGSRIARCHARSSIASALSNRELQLLEPRLTHRKQTIAPRSNRELSTNRCRANSHLRIVCMGGGCSKAPIGRLAAPGKSRSGDGQGLLWRGEKSLTITAREILVQGRGVPSRMGRLC